MSDQQELEPGAKQMEQELAEQSQSPRAQAIANQPEREAKAEDKAADKEAGEPKTGVNRPPLRAAAALRI